MSAALMDWVEERWRTWAVGVLVWVLLAGAAALYARARGLNPWQQVVTWDEWVFAIGILPRMIVPIFQKREMVDERAKRVVGWVGEFTWVLFILLFLDLITRAVLGLGWDPF